MGDGQNKLQLRPFTETFNTHTHTHARACTHSFWLISPICYYHLQFWIKHGQEFIKETEKSVETLAWRYCLVLLMSLLTNSPWFTDGFNPLILCTPPALPSARESKNLRALVIMWAILVCLSHSQHPQLKQIVPFFPLLRLLTGCKKPNWQIHFSYQYYR